MVGAASWAEGALVVDTNRLALVLVKSVLVVAEEAKEGAAAREEPVRLELEIY